MRRELVANYSLLYTIEGSQPQLKPYMLCSHLDVVPIEDDKWTVPAFKGLKRDGWIYGRGAIDVKDTLIVSTFRVYLSLLSCYSLSLLLLLFLFFVLLA